MCVCVCVCVRVCVCVCVCMYVNACVCPLVLAWIISMYTQTDIHTYVHTAACTHRIVQLWAEVGKHPVPLKGSHCSFLHTTIQPAGRTLLVISTPFS